MARRFSVRVALVAARHAQVVRAAARVRVVQVQVPLARVPRPVVRRGALPVQVDLALAAPVPLVRAVPVERLAQVPVVRVVLRAAEAWAMAVSP